MSMPKILEGLKTKERMIVDVRPGEIITNADTPYPCYRGKQEEGLRHFLLQTRFVGLLRYGDCRAKNEIVFEELRNTVPHMKLVEGAMRVWSEEAGAFYGFNYEPPAEYHVWIEVGTEPYVSYIDLALGGVIKRGSLSGDDQGPYLVGIEPFVLWGQVCPFVFYEAKKVLKEVTV